MAETIRDVIVRVAIQQVQAKIAAPDVAPTVAAQQKVTREVVEGYKLQENAYRTARTSKIQEVREQEYFALAVRIAQQQNHAESTKILQAETAQRRRFATQQRQDLEAIAAAQANVNRQLGSALREGSEGFLRLARGATLLAANNKDLEKLVQILVGFQIGFDVLIGGQKTLENLTKGWQAYTSTAQGAAIASRALWLATNPITLTVAAAAGTFYVLKQALDATTKAYEDNSRAANASNAAKIAQIHGTQIGGQNPFLRIGGKSGGRGLDEDFKQRIREEQAAIDSAFQRRIDSAQSRFSEADRIRALHSEVPLRERLLDLQRESNKLLQQFGQQQGSADVGLAREQKQAVIAERLAALEQQKFDAIRNSGEKLKEILRSEQERLHTAQEALKTEKARVQSLESSFGRLSAGEQAEARRLAEKKQAGGTLNEFELRRLEELGVGRQFTEREFASRGRAAGADAVAAAFGEGSQVDRLTQAARDIRGTGLGGGLEDITEAIEDNAAEEKRQLERLIEAIRAANVERNQAIEKAALEAEAAAAAREALAKANAS